MQNTTNQISDKDFLMLDEKLLPTFIQAFSVIMERIPPTLLSCNAKILYCKMYSLYNYYNSLHKDAVISDTRSLLAKYSGLTGKQFDTAIDKLIEVDLVTDLTPGLKNRSHIYVVKEWKHRKDLMTEKTVAEIRAENKITGIAIDKIDFNLDSAFPKGKADLVNNDEIDDSAFPKGKATSQKGKATFPKGKAESPKGNMNKIGIDPTYTNKDIIEDEVVEVITNATSHKEGIVTEDSKSVSLPSSDNLLSSIVTSSSGGEPEEEAQLPFLKGTEISNKTFSDFLNDRANKIYLENKTFVEVKDLLIIYRENNNSWPDRFKHDSKPQRATETVYTSTGDNLY